MSEPNNNNNNNNNEERKVRFNNEIETKIIENEVIDNNINNNNNNNRKAETEEDFEKQILKQIEIGNKKQAKRDEEFKKKNRIQNLAKEHKYKEEVINGQIDSVEGEKQYDDEQEEYEEQEVSKIFKKVRGRRAFKNDDEYSDDEDNDEEENEKEEEEKNEIEIDSFNLESENQDLGHFDEGGNFIFKKDQKEKDAWLQEYDQVWSNKVPKLSKRELKRQDAEQTEEEEDLWEKEHHEELKKRRLGLSNDEKSLRLERLNKIYNILQSDSESILSALRRLTGNTTNKRPEIKRKNPPKNQRTNTTTTTTTTTTTPIQSEADKKQFNQLTELADALLSGGYVNIYSETKQSIGNTFKKESYQPL